MIDVKQTCPCKGIRCCLLCQHSDRVRKLNRKAFPFEAYKAFILCARCIGIAHPLIPKFYSIAELLDFQQNMHESCQELQGCSVQSVFLVDNFISQKEENDLQATMDSVGWQPSQSGRRKQDYGPRANFKKRKVKPAKRPLPDYANFLFQRLTTIDCLNGFVPVELSNLDYDSSRGSWIDFHKDDCWLWGDRIVTCNLLSDTVLSFLEDETNTLIYVPLKRRSLCCFSGNVRVAFKHGIFPQHIVGRRIVMTIREPSTWCQSGKLENENIP
ncbi:hypothetical protein TTRE_0000591901 [Trichuris trichiura]|uniref:Uncharacterized protein n=1 Tax=Trichuris trichiura TaxID=36087 RepID=A0A077ZBA7_TRITR|nr:hypothetical protein TTRE_0000591901 [Trichuris trichiura]